MESNVIHCAQSAFDSMRTCERAEIANLQMSQIGIMTMPARASECVLARYDGASAQLKQLELRGDASEP